MNVKSSLKKNGFWTSSMKHSMKQPTLIVSGYTLGLPCLCSLLTCTISNLIIYLYINKNVQDISTLKVLRIFTNLLVYHIWYRATLQLSKEEPSLPNVTGDVGESAAKPAAFMGLECNIWTGFQLSASKQLPSTFMLLAFIHQTCK